MASLPPAGRPACLPGFLLQVRPAWGVHAHHPQRGGASALPGPASRFGARFASLFCMPAGSLPCHAPPALQVDVIGRQFGRQFHVCTFGYGHPVGELEFINNHVCVADVIAKTGASPLAGLLATILPFAC